MKSSIQAIDTRDNHEYNPNEKMARELAELGIMPTMNECPIGATFEIAGQIFKIYATATKEDFITAFRASSITRFREEEIEAPYFYKISTD